MKFYTDIKDKFCQLITDENIWTSQINIVNVRALTPQEAIGNPDRDDFPLLKGKEVMIQADFKGSKGQAFTDMPGNYNGTLRDIFEMPLINNFQRAIFTASLNAVLRSLNIIFNTMHCRDKEPGICSFHLKEYVKSRFGKARIAFIGFQPAMISTLGKDFEMRVIDLDRDHIGKRKAGVLIESVSKTNEILNWSDIILATGTTAANNTLTTLLNEKPIVFYGVTISGIAHLMGYEHFCYCSH
jgi:molybdopterin/thiamine biosynthesis adenylyltransferase